jgi:hypothetical protein
MYSSTHSVTSALDGGEWSASRTGRFTPREGDPGTHWIGDWVGPTAVLDAVVKRKITIKVKLRNVTDVKNLRDMYNISDKVYDYVSSSEQDTTRM